MSVHAIPASKLSQTIVLPDEAATLSIGGALAQRVQAGTLIFLEGDLGAGKTTLSRGFLQGLGIKGRIKSPTYTLVEPYELPSFVVYHFDLYRFADPVEWLDAGFQELLNQSSVALVEWPVKAAGCLPVPDLIATLTPQGSGRGLQLDAFTETGIVCLTQLEIPIFTSTS